VSFTPPPRSVEKVLLRMPLPDGWQVTSATVDGKSAALSDDYAVDLSGNQQRVSVRFEVKQSTSTN
jgi:hypothetical protein